ncbi:MAG: hypothetical protein ABIJ05_05175 [Patescibacteria group bacterium]
MLEISSAKLTGNPTLPGWSQAYDYKPENPEQLEKRGHLFAIIATSREDEGVDKVSAGREILTRLHEEYFGKLEGTPFNSLKSAIEKVINEFSPTWGDIEIAAVSLIENVIYSAAGGGSQVAVLRRGMFAKILQSKEKEVANASGYPEDGDILLLGSKEFFEGLTDSFIKESLEKASIEESAETLNSYLSGKEKGNVGVVILKFSLDKKLFPEADIQTQPKKDLTENVKSISNKVSSAFSKLNFSLSKRLPQRKIYIKGNMEELPEKKKTTLSVGAILLILLVVSIGFGIRQKRLNDQKEKYLGRLTEASQKYQESISLFSLEPTKAREMFREAYETVNAIKAEGVNDSDLDKLIEEMNLKKGEILGEYKKDANLFIDLSLLSSGFSGDNLSYSLGKLFILDKNSKKVVSLALDTKKTQVVAGPDRIETVSMMTAYEDDVYLLEDDGIYLVNTKRDKRIKKDWDGEVFFEAYAGNIYLLEKGQNMIWRFIGDDGTFSEKSKWLAPGVETDFSLVKKIAIDGSIWILTSSGKINKFTLGNSVNFSFSGESPKLTSLDSFYTNEDLDHIYVMDKTQKRIVVFDKEANFVSQYYADAITEAKDFMVTEEEGKIILLTGDKLYSLDL